MYLKTPQDRRNRLSRTQRPIYFAETPRLCNLVPRRDASQ